MASLSADQLIEATSRAKVEARALATKLEAARKGEQVERQRANAAEGLAADLRNEVKALALDSSVSRDEAAREIARLKSELASLEDAREEASVAKKELAPQTKRADDAEGDLAAANAERGDLLSEIGRLKSENTKLTARLGDFLEAVRRLEKQG